MQIQVGIRFAAALLAAGAMLGCAKSHESVEARPAVSPSDATHADPTLAELPDLTNKYERTIAAKVGVLEMNKPPRVRIVADYKEPPLTPEEKAAVGEDKPKPGDDLLAFYRPERGPEHGVHPLESRVEAGIFGRGGGTIGLVPASHSYSSWGLAGFDSKIDPGNRSQAMSYDVLPKKAGVGPESRVHSGEGDPRRGAQRADRLD